jgi:hypothetical protein
MASNCCPKLKNKYEDRYKKINPKDKKTNNNITTESTSGDFLEQNL